MRALMVTALCVAGWAAGAGAEDSLALKEGRWTGQFGGTSIVSGRCSDPKKCTLTLDIVHCGGQWCGVGVDNAGACIGEFMRLKSSGGPDEFKGYNGELKLIEGTAPYAVRAWMRKADTGKPELRVIGDSGGKFLSRTFSLHATLARIGDVQCRETS